MTYVKIGDRQIEATIAGKNIDRDWDGRHSKAVTCEMTYEEAAALFQAGSAWSIVYQAPAYEQPVTNTVPVTDKDGNPVLDEEGNPVTEEVTSVEVVTPAPEEYDNSDFVVAGSITDNRDGTVTVKMGKKTELELTAEERDQALTELEDVLLIAYGGI